MFYLKNFNGKINKWNPSECFVPAIHKNKEINNKKGVVGMVEFAPAAQTFYKNIAAANAGVVDNGKTQRMRMCAFKAVPPLISTAEGFFTGPESMM